jgi:1-acyl-sn-glycerol-3-phosphate acyltransferase
MYILILLNKASFSQYWFEFQVKIWLFPEGTRNKNYTKMLPFKKGAFAMAISAQVPVIPVVFSPYYFINRTKHLFQKGKELNFSIVLLEKGV